LPKKVFIKQGLLKVSVETMRKISTHRSPRHDNDGSDGITMCLSLFIKSYDITSSTLLYASIFARRVLTELLVVFIKSSTIIILPL
jgi:hypothetical protein